MYCGLSLGAHSQKRPPSLIRPQILATPRYLLLPLTKGHLPNMATISWQIGWPYWGGGDYCMVKFDHIIFGTTFDYVSLISPYLNHIWYTRNVCCCWTLDSSKGRCSNLLESFFETTDISYRWKLTLTPANIRRNFELSTRLHGASSENWGFRVVVTDISSTPSGLVHCDSLDLFTVNNSTTTCTRNGRNDCHFKAWLWKVRTSSSAYMV